MLPASAGMIPKTGRGKMKLLSAPRIRGDDPSPLDRRAGISSCSPHPRG